MNEFQNMPSKILYASSLNSLQMYDFTISITLGSSVDPTFTSINLMESLPTNVILCGSSGKDTIEVRRSSDWQMRSQPNVALETGNGVKQIRSINDLGGFAVVGSSSIEIFDETYARKYIINPLGIGDSTILSVSALTGDDSHLLVGTQTFGKILLNYNYKTEKIFENLDPDNSNLEINISKIVVSTDKKIVVSVGKTAKLYIFKESAPPASSENPSGSSSPSNSSDKGNNQNS